MSAECTFFNTETTLLDSGPHLPFARFYQSNSLPTWLPTTLLTLLGLFEKVLALYLISRDSLRSSSVTPWDLSTGLLFCRIKFPSFVAIEIATPSFRSRKGKYILPPMLILPLLLVLVESTSFCPSVCSTICLIQMRSPFFSLIILNS